MVDDHGTLLTFSSNVRGASSSALSGSTMLGHAGVLHLEYPPHPPSGETYLERLPWETSIYWQVVALFR